MYELMFALTKQTIIPCSLHCHYFKFQTQMKILSTQKGRIGVTQMLFLYNHSVYGYCAFLIYHLNLGICITTKV